jgi:hypothetical protein
MLRIEFPYQQKPAGVIKLNSSLPELEALRFVFEGKTLYEPVAGQFATLNGGVTKVVTRHGKGYNFNGSTGNIEFASIVDDDFPSAEMAGIFICKSNTSTAWQCLFSRTASGNNLQPWFGYDNANRLACYFNSAVTYNPGGNEHLNYHVIGFAITGTTTRLYFDGAEVASGTTSAVTSTGTGNIEVGANATTGDYFNGDGVFGFVLDKAPSRERMMELSLNPYQIYAPKVVHVEIISAAGVTETITKAAMSLTGQNINAVQNESITKDTLTYSPKNFEEYTAITETITKDTLTYTGNPFQDLGDIIETITAAAMAYTGNTLNINAEVIEIIADGSLVYTGNGMNLQDTIILLKDSLLYNPGTFSFTGELAVTTRWYNRRTGEILGTKTLVTNPYNTRNY